MGYLTLGRGDQLFWPYIRGCICIFTGVVCVYVVPPERRSSRIVTWHANDEDEHQQTNTTDERSPKSARLQGGGSKGGRQEGKAMDGSGFSYKISPASSDQACLTGPPVKSTIAGYAYICYRTGREGVCKLHALQSNMPTVPHLTVLERKKQNLDLTMICADRYVRTIAGNQAQNLCRAAEGRSGR